MSEEIRKNDYNQNTPYDGFLIQAPVRSVGGFDQVLSSAGGEVWGVSTDGQIPKSYVLMSEEVMQQQDLTTTTITFEKIVVLRANVPDGLVWIDIIIGRGKKVLPGIS